MATRYCGGMKIDLDCEGLFEGRLKFGGRITTSEGDPWEFDDVLVDQQDPDEKAFDIAAAGAVHYGSLYGPGYDPETDGGEVPDWAPEPDVASAINDDISHNDRGYCIRRTKDGANTYCG